MKEEDWTYGYNWFIINEDGSDQTLLDILSHDIQISNDGKLIYYHTSLDWSVNSMNIDGTNKQKIFTESFLVQFDISPDNSEIAYIYHGFIYE